MKRSQKIRVLLVDDHPCVLEGVRTRLRKVSWISIVGVATTGGDAIEKARVLRPNVVVMDLSLPDMSGIDAISVIRIEQPTVKHIAYTMHAENEYFVRALEVGVAGYVLKTSSSNVLVRAVQVTANGKSFFDKKISILPSCHNFTENDLLSSTDPLKTHTYYDASVVYTRDPVELAAKATGKPQGISEEVIGLVKLQRSNPGTANSHDGGRPFDQRIDNTLRCIGSHLKHIRTIQDVAKRIGVPAETLRKIFYRTTGINLSDYVSKVRVERMKKALANTELPCKVICLAWGYREDAGERLFRRTVGCSMYEFRSRLRRRGNL